MSTRVPLLACIAVLSFFAGITGVRLAYTLAYVLIVVMVAALLWSRTIARRLDVERESPAGDHSAGDVFTETFVLRNRSPLPVPYCEARDLGSLEGYQPGRACAITGGGTVTWTARGAFTRRGRHVLGPLEVRLGDPFGLFPHTVRAGSPAEVLVHPVIHPLGDLLSTWSAASVTDERARRSADIPPDASTVREYDPGDGLNRIHWPTSARTGRLMSRAYDTSLGSDLLVVLDLRAGIHAGTAPESSLEYAVSVAASLCHATLRRGAAAALVTNDSARSALGAGRGEVQRRRILDYLACARDDGVTPLAEVIARHGDAWRSRGGIVVVTSAGDDGWVPALIASSARGRRHLCIHVDPTSFGAPGEPLRVPAAWRLALEWRVVRRGDVLGERPAARVAGL